MQRTSAWIFLVALGLASPGPRAAGAPSQSGPPKGKATPRQTPRGASNTQALAKRLIGQLRKLRVAMRSQLDLSSDQTQAVDKLFNAYLSELSAAGQGRGPFGTRAGDEQTLQALRRKMTAAREAGDQEAVQALRRQFQQMMGSRTGATALTVSQFIRKLEMPLRKRQQQALHKLVRQLRIGASSPKRDRSADRIRSLWRSALRPEMKLSREQQRAIREILRDGLSAIAKARRNRRPTDQVAERIEQDVVAQLSESQRARLKKRRSPKRSTVQASEPSPVGDDGLDGGGRSSSKPPAEGEKLKDETPPPGG